MASQKDSRRASLAGMTAFGFFHAFINRLYLKRKQLRGYDFHRQKPIDDYIADFFCNKLQLAIELDGYTHSFEGEIFILALRFLTEFTLNV